MAGGTGLPPALLAVGASLERMPKPADRGWLLLLSFGTLVLTPCATLLSYRLFADDAGSLAVGVGTLLIATPMAASGPVLCRKMGVEPEFMAAHVVLSTALSVLSLPVWVYILL